MIIPAVSACGEPQKVILGGAPPGSPEITAAQALEKLHDIEIKLGLPKTEEPVHFIRTFEPERGNPFVREVLEFDGRDVLLSVDIYRGKIESLVLHEVSSRYYKNAERKREAGLALSPCKSQEEIITLVKDYMKKLDVTVPADYKLGHATYDDGEWDVEFNREVPGYLVKNDGYSFLVVDETGELRLYVNHAFPPVYKTSVKVRPEDAFVTAEKHMKKIMASPPLSEVPFEIVEHGEPVLMLEYPRSVSFPPSELSKSNEPKPGLVLTEKSLCLAFAIRFGINEWKGAKPHYTNYFEVLVDAETGEVMGLTR